MWWIFMDILKLMKEVRGVCHFVTLRVCFHFIKTKHMPYTVNCLSVIK
jgi:hypothetical protein